MARSKRVKYSPREIVKIPHTSGYGRERTTGYLYAIRRIATYGWFKKEQEVQWLKLRSMDDGHAWEYQKDYELRSDSFRNTFTVEKPETILEKWNHKPKTEREKFVEKYGEAVDVKNLQQNLEEIQEDEEINNRHTRLGVNE